MKNIFIKRFAILFVVISAIAWCILACILGKDLSNIDEFLSLVPQVIGTDVVIFSIFAKWGWKWKLFRGWLVRFADLNGTWLGSANSDWINPSTNRGISPVPVMLTIKQTFISIHCVSRTAEMESHSYAESFVINEEEQIKALAFFSTNTPLTSVRPRNQPHDTATYLRIIEKPERKLKGCYWTQRHTVGEVTFEFYSKELHEELPEGIGEHPITEFERNNDVKENCQQ